MKVIFLGNQDSSIKGLEYLAEKESDVLVVTQSEELKIVAQEYNLTAIPENKLYKDIGNGNRILEGTDLVISYGYHKLIKKPLINLPRIGCINFHPAPLPAFRGMGGVYNFAIYEGVETWGVTAHFVDESFDTGDIIGIREFKINPEEETAYSLKEKSHRQLMILYKSIIDAIYEGKELPRTPQWEGRYISRQDFEQLRRMQPMDSLEEIDRKIRAFWCPPYDGAYIELHGKEFTLVNSKMLKRISE